ncbi:MAG: DNA alkylation repair protein [Capsulimonadaceae bacterium]|nr:DNA alkylation repair protein [Capsulimonadaceae bacterium]
MKSAPPQGKGALFPQQTGYHSHMTVANIQQDLRELADPEKAKILSGFFKTGPGQYGEGDQFLGIVVDKTRALAKRYRHLGLDEIGVLLDSRVHEDRLVALLILTLQYPIADETSRAAIYRFYLAHTDRVNNWDLVDCSAEHIVGPYLRDRDKTPLTTLAQSASVWERRIAILATYHYIKLGDPSETFRIAEALLGDSHDLIHKAVGWMLREAGKRCSTEALCAFLDGHGERMPRTMLRYAIERFSPEKRAQYMLLGARSRRKA